MRVLVSTLALVAVACSSEPEAVDIEAIPDEGEIVTPPFEVAGDADGLLLVWFDDEGQHTAATRDDIPPEHRDRVRVEDLSSEDELDPGLVYVADMRQPGAGGAYEVRRMPRDAFEEAIAEASGSAEGAVAALDPDADVVLYGASWCSACRGAAAYLREQQVPFVERDIEQEPGARQAMMEAAQRAGIRPSGIPVIDFRGEVIAGFDRGALSRAIERSRAAL